MTQSVCKRNQNSKDGNCRWRWAKWLPWNTISMRPAMRVWKEEEVREVEDFMWNQVSCNYITRNIITQFFVKQYSSIFKRSKYSMLIVKYFVKSICNLNAFRWFHGIFVKHSLCTVWKLQKFSFTLFSQKFRGFTKEIEITIELIWRNFFSVRENFSFFFTVLCGNHGILLPATITTL